MRRNPLYSFKGRDSIGIYQVPLNTTIHILNDGTGRPIFVELLSKEGLNPGSVIGDLLDNPDLYVNLSEDELDPSELEKITENGNTGWRLLGRNPDNYGDIGQDAVDFSLSETSGNFGAMGDNSFVSGLNNAAANNTAFVAGLNNRSYKDSQVIFGRYNSDQTITTTHSNAQVIIGNGNSSATNNSIEIYEDGAIYAPNLEKNLIVEDKILVTKEYADDIDGGDL